MLKLNYLLALSLFTRAQGVTIEKVEWHDVPPLPMPVSDMTASTIGDNIYIIGGCAADQVRAPWDNTLFYCATITDRCDVFNIVTEQYTTCAVAPRQRYRHAAVPIDGSVWLVGGRDDQDNIVTQIDVYNPVSNTWTTPVNWTDATSDLAAFTNGTSLFVVGGYNASYNASDSLWKFEPSTLAQGTFAIQTMADLTQGRGDTSAVTIGKYAYVSGGWHHDDFCDPLTSVERYDMVANQWTTIAPLGTGRADKAMAVLHGHIFAIGGEHNDNCATVSGGSTPLNDVEVLDTTGDSPRWVVKTEIPEERFRFVAATDEGSLEAIYVFGGQHHYNASCDCFGITDNVLRFTLNVASGATATAPLPFVLAMVLPLALWL